MTLSKEAQLILEKWQELQAIRNEPKFLSGVKDFVTGNYYRHYDCYRELKYEVQRNENALLELILSGEITDERHLHELIFFGGHGGSVAYEDNRQWHGFMRKVRQHQDKFPSGIRSTLAWLKVTHGW